MIAAQPGAVIRRAKQGIESADIAAAAQGGSVRRDEEIVRANHRAPPLRALGVTLVTNNVAEFERVPKLTIQNWTITPRRKR